MSKTEIQPFPRIFTFRFDGKEGHQTLIPTEINGVSRMRVFNPQGEVERRYLVDILGAPFVDIEDIKDKEGDINSEPSVRDNRIF